MNKRTKVIKEIELNFPVKDSEGLLNFLRQKGQESILNIKFHYFESPTDKSFYIRTEERGAENSSKKFLTIKYNINDDKVSGLNKRKEMSIEIKDIDYYLKFFKIIGLEYLGSKTKKRHLFEIDGMKVTLDEWNTEELGNRLEIEGLNIEKIREFKKEIILYIKE